MADISNGGNQQVIISDENDNNVIVKNNKLTTDSRVAKEFAVPDSFGIPKTSNERLLKEFQFSESIMQINFKETIVASGNITFPGAQGFLLSSGAASSSSIIEQSKQPISQPTLEGVITRWPISFQTAGIAGNIRSFGLNDGVDGWMIRLNGTVLEFVQLKGGVETVTPSSNWDVPVTPDTNIQLWMIQSKSIAAGDYDIWYGENNLVHTIRTLGTVSTPQSNKINLPLRFENINDTATTDEKIFVTSVTVNSEGQQSVRVTDGIRDLLLSEDRRVLVQQFGNELMGENFDEPIDIVQRWDETIVGSATKIETANTHTLKFRTTTGATDSILEIFREDQLVQTVGSFSSFEVGASFGDTLVTDNVREWGYLDSGLLNGCFFRIDGSDLKFVTVKGGVETETILAGSLPNLNFHLYKITQLGAGKIAGFIDNTQIVDFTPAAISLVGSSFKKPFMKMYNNAALGGAPSDCEFHWMNLIDKGGTATSISVLDENNIIRKVAGTSNGEMKVEVVEGAPPTASDPVFEFQTDVISGTDDFFYTITNLKTLTVQRFLAGYVTPSSGDSVVELYWAPNGNTTGIVIISNKNGPTTSTQTVNLNQVGGVSLDGDGTAAILIRRRKTGGGSTEITGSFTGFEVTT